MADTWNWTCPFCGHHTTVTRDRISRDEHRIDLPTKHGRKALFSRAIACANDKCRELYLDVHLTSYEIHPTGGVASHGPREATWGLIPQGSAKPLPDYIPKAIQDDYREACLIEKLSPKASATLSRRCLQGMIRDFWGIKKKKLFDAIKGLQGKVQTSTWKAIDAVRKIGNVGAHMEKDINVIVDVDPGEARLLIELIETLIKDWYVERHEREERNRALVMAAEAKKPAATSPQSPEAGAGGDGSAS